MILLGILLFVLDVVLFECWYRADLMKRMGR
jgi:hypothetical protein